MKPVLYTAKDAKKIDLETKIILKYPTPSNKYDIAHMTVNGRFPKNGKFMVNNICDFFIYVLKGTGIIFAGIEIFQVRPTDVVFVPSKNKYAVEGQFEYITIDVPEFSDKQAEMVG